jgi:5'-nucleotidase
MKILVTNDDGVRSPGLEALARALSRLGAVTIVAPTREASAIGHALTLHHPLRFEHIEENVYAVDGTPTDCVNIAVATILGGLPDLIASGINKGLNVGDDVTYSGTVSGALEGALLGVPSIAVSLERTKAEYDFTHAAEAAARVAEAVLRHGLPPRTFLNVNVPFGKPRGLRVTVQAQRSHVTSVSARRDPKGRPYYWIGEAQDQWEAHARSDHQAIEDRFVSVTPMQPDMTAHEALRLVEAMGLSGSNGSGPDAKRVDDGEQAVEDVSDGDAAAADPRRRAGAGEAG